MLISLSHLKTSNESLEIGGFEKIFNVLLQKF